MTKSFSAQFWHLIVSQAQDCWITGLLTIQKLQTSNNWFSGSIWYVHGSIWCPCCPLWRDRDNMARNHFSASPQHQRWASWIDEGSCKSTLFAQGTCIRSTGPQVMNHWVKKTPEKKDATARLCSHAHTHTRTHARTNARTHDTHWCEIFGNKINNENRESQIYQFSQRTNRGDLCLSVELCAREKETAEPADWLRLEEVRPAIYEKCSVRESQRWFLAKS